MKTISGYRVARYFDDCFEKYVSATFPSKDEAKAFMYENFKSGAYVSFEVRAVFKDNGI